MHSLLLTYVQSILTNPFVKLKIILPFLLLLILNLIVF